MIYDFDKILKSYWINRILNGYIKMIFKFSI